MARSGLARAHVQLGEPATALLTAAQARELPFLPGKPAMQLLEGLAQLQLNRLEESVQAFSDAGRCCTRELPSLTVEAQPSLAGRREPSPLDPPAVDHRSCAGVAIQG